MQQSTLVLVLKHALAQVPSAQVMNVKFDCACNMRLSPLNISSASEVLLSTFKYYLCNYLILMSYHYVNLKNVLKIMVRTRMLKMLYQVMMFIRSNS